MTQPDPIPYTLLYKRRPVCGRQMKRQTGRLLLCLLALLTLCGCNRQRPRKYVIGVSQCSQDVWRDKLNRELKTSEYFNDSLEVRLASANDNSRRQMEQINQFVDEGVDLLVVAPNQYRSITPAIERAYNRGIPVILYDRKTNSNKFTAFIGADNYGIGKAMGQFIARQLKGRGRVVEIRGLEGSSPAAERHKGFVDAIKAWPGVQLVASEAGNWKEESAIRAMGRILKKTRDFDYVYGQNDRMAWGAYVALRQHGIRRPVKFTGVDGLATEGGGLELVRDGVFEATSFYPTQGEAVIALAMKILRGQPYSRDNLLETTVITRDNAEMMLREARELARQNDNLDMLHRQVDRYFTQYNNQKIIILLFVGLIVLMVIVVVNMYRANITKKRLNRQLRQRNDELQRLSREVEDMTRGQLAFFTNVSHELRTPLTLIQGPIERLLEELPQPDERRQLLQTAQRNANILQQLVDEILDFRKVQNGKMELTLSRFSLGDSLADWCRDFRVAAGRRHINLQMADELTDGGVIVADKDKLAHIYFNLMTNALKYTPAGGTITTSVTDEGDSYAFSVKDTGMGIGTADLPNIFKRFYQAQGAAGGTGIGLAIVQAYATLHHGTVTVESQTGSGTCFTVTLPKVQQGPVGEASNAPHTAARLQASPYANDTVNARQYFDDVVATEQNAQPEVLVIDDNGDMRAYLRTILKEKYHITEAADGRQGLALARRTVPDVVVCDVMMPVMDGMAFTRALKDDTATSHIPVILLTARSLDDQKAEGYSLGADSYLTKPFQANVLLARIDNLLQNRARLYALFSTARKDGSEDDTDEAGTTPTAAPATGDKDRRFVGRLRKIVQTHLADADFNVERIGEEIGLSRVQLYRKVKALTGQSPVELLRSARLQRGRHLIETTDMTVSEVAYDVGFTSPSYFTKCFKDEFGQNPNELRS